MPFCIYSVGIVEGFPRVKNSVVMNKLHVAGLKWYFYVILMRQFFQKGQAFMLCRRVGVLCKKSSHRIDI